jgi:hypothetical protein
MKSLKLAGLRAYSDSSTVMLGVYCTALLPAAASLAQMRHHAAMSKKQLLALSRLPGILQSDDCTAQPWHATNNTPRHVFNELQCNVQQSICCMLARLANR